MSRNSAKREIGSIRKARKGRKEIATDKGRIDADDG